MTRRELHGLLLAPALQAQPPDPGDLRALPLDPASRQALSEAVHRAIRQAEQLRELPLDGVPPGFVFLAD
jgi:hypothetical protein